MEMWSYLNWHGEVGVPPLVDFIRKQDFPAKLVLNFGSLNSLRIYSFLTPTLLFPTRSGV